MNVALLVLTIVSLVAAVGFGMLTWHLIREDRQRSLARVAALASAIDADTVHLHTSSPVSPVAVGTMFGAASSTRGRPVIRASIIGAMAVTLIVAVAMATGRGSRPEQARPEQAAPLELVSMRHVRQGATLTVSGLVRNPSAGAPAGDLTAVVFAFDRNGTFVASGRAPLDVRRLEPGDESPFVVAVPDVEDVGKYRVSFRTDVGLMRHVDRRADQASITATLR